jgi:MoaD family protein
MYATIRELAGTSELDIEAVSLSELMRVLSGRYGLRFSRFLKAGGAEDGIVILVNGRNVAFRPDLMLRNGDEVSIFPPLSGG